MKIVCWIKYNYRNHIFIAICAWTIETRSEELGYDATNRHQVDDTENCVFLFRNLEIQRSGLIRNWTIFSTQANTDIFLQVCIKSQ